ncbi:hypothetical protein [Mesobacillus selenatarsenatis]|uniref:FAD/FMN-containing dehydrogenase n=1 Tax=Mesobacillus selenatarsenatis (strain DSM 18680 / JCM 14380 / FERM P-15431 / SF-1) TaxID=1321606 RepID=A0A0A8WZ26_MESS1|nr:hypothetical protein [Mesobacillus selenatarsenatis]GAM12955.1 hypothetical protein SAMD00020551_1090 [Mesobacillus selenatarsenatis SF-1]
MKKLTLSFLGAAMIVGASTAAFAEEGTEGKGTFNFGQMKPLIEKMHPDLSDEEVKQMYNDCHGTNSAMPSKNFNMMDPNHMDIVD